MAGRKTSTTATSREPTLRDRRVQVINSNNNNSQYLGYEEDDYDEDEMNIIDVNGSYISSGNAVEGSRNMRLIPRLNTLEVTVENGGEMRPNKLFPVQNEKDEILRKVRSVLNKVSSVNYNRLRKRWLSLMPNGSEEEEKETDGPKLSLNQISEVLQLVIAKALDDTIYMHIYAGLMGYVVARKPPEIATTIRQLVNCQLHHELQRLTTDKELALYHRSTVTLDATRRKKVSLHRFIAELYGEKACTSRFLYERVTDLLIVNNPVDIDENVECLCILMTFAGQKLEEAKKSWVEDIFRKLVQRQTETPSMVSKRIQFMILDLIEMRESNWSPHNKWWSPSVQRAPERERTRSTPCPIIASLPSNSSSFANNNSEVTHNNTLPPTQIIQTQRVQEEPPQKLQKNNSGNSSRSRTRSEGSGIKVLTSSSTTLPHLQDNSLELTSNNSDTSVSIINQQRKRDCKELSANQSRQLMALMNKVSPCNVDKIAQQLYEVLTEETAEVAVTFIVEKILDDSFYTKTYVSLIRQVAAKPNMKTFGGRIASKLMSILEQNPISKEGFHLLAELYNLGMVTKSQVVIALKWLMDCVNVKKGTFNAAMESLVILLFVSGAKLDADVNDEHWMNHLLEFWEKKANQVAQNQGRALCLLRDVVELRQNKWSPVRHPHWIPPTNDLPTIRFEAESLIRLFQSDRKAFLRFVRGETSTLPRLERFTKEALEYGVRNGNYQKDPEFLKVTGSCIRVLLEERLLQRTKFDALMGTFVQRVVNMRRYNSKAWDNWGLIMSEVY